MDVVIFFSGIIVTLIVWFGILYTVYRGNEKPKGFDLESKIGDSFAGKSD